MPFSLAEASRNFSAPIVDSSKQTILGLTALGADAWGRQKTITDFSLVHCLFTFDVPLDTWIIIDNNIEVLGGSPKVLSVNGALELSSGTTDVYLHTRRHPRYQPNRGHLYSASIFLPNPTALGERNFGMFNKEAGVFFRLKASGELFGVIRTVVDNVQGEIEYPIPHPKRTDASPIDYSLGHTYDIQMQWRGVGDIVFYIDQKRVLVISNTDTLDHVYMFNPALPIAFSSVNLGQEVKIKCGCADITSEGGNRQRKQYRSLPSGERAITTTETPMVLFTVADTVFGRTNTRDCILLKIEAYSDANSVIRVYYTRDSTAFTFTVPMVPVYSGFQKVSYDGNITVANYTKMTKLHEKRLAANTSDTITNPDIENTEFYMVHGDYILVTIQAKNNALGGATLVYGEEV